MHARGSRSSARCLSLISLALSLHAMCERTEGEKNLLSLALSYYLIPTIFDRVSIESSEVCPSHSLTNRSKTMSPILLLLLVLGVVSANFKPEREFEVKQANLLNNGRGYL